MAVDPTALAAAAKAMAAVYDAAALSGSTGQVAPVDTQAALACVTAYLAALPAIDAAGLVERLRQYATAFGISIGEHVERDLDEAADTITRLSREVGELRKALRDLVDAIEYPRCGDDSVWDYIYGIGDGPGPLDRVIACLPPKDDKP